MIVAPILDYSTLNAPGLCALERHFLGYKTKGWSGEDELPAAFIAGSRMIAIRSLGTVLTKLVITQ